MKGSPMADKHNFQEMLSYMRPEGSIHQKKFCRRYIEPTFGKSDEHGNYTKIIGDKPDVAFMAHHDTVHKDSGRSDVKLSNGFYTVESSKTTTERGFQTFSPNCLGADCTTGVYIILKMIEAKVPGVYVIHAGEEIGCVGSRALVFDNPDWISHVKYAISFDRKGYSSIITHQLGLRTCSDKFGESLATVLDLHYELDNTGAYTDSNEYAFVIPECTNISVGYFNQHTHSESQDKVFLDMLIEKLIAADWSKLVCERDPSKYESLYPKKGYSTFGARGWEDYYPEDDYMDIGPEPSAGGTILAMAEIIEKHPTIVAYLLNDLGYDAYDLLDEIQDYKADIRPKRGFS